jgi:hypothetical protein
VSSAKVAPPEIVISPEPRTEVPLIVLILVPETKVL